MTDVYGELSKTNKQVDAHMKSVEPLPDYITDAVNVDWRDELYDGYDWPWGEWFVKLYWLLAVVVLVCLVAGYLYGALI